VKSHGARRVAAAAALAVSFAVAEPGRVAGEDRGRWVGTWAASPQLTEDENLPPLPGFVDTTLRQLLRVSIGGKQLRVRVSNAFGRTPLTLGSVRVARSAGGGAIVPETDRAVTFHGQAAVTIPEGALALSDPVDFDLPPFGDLAVTVYLRGAPAEVTGHPGSRTTSYLQPGNVASARELPGAVRVDHWYFLSGIDVLAGVSAAALAVLGDSITDGRGSTTNGNDRWPDVLARRLRANAATSEVAVLNHGIGGNRLLRDGKGPNALARLDRDVLAQPGVRWLVVLEGVNDLGTASQARARGEARARAADLIAAYEQIVERAHAHDIRVYGATIMPFGGFTAYASPEAEADRQTVNAWIRSSRIFDAVIDFDEVARDAENPSRLSPAVDGGDQLHPSAAGYKILADAVDLRLFGPR
jgi:lysophospholipase L1-like esterase